MPKNSRSAMRALKRGHAMIHDSSLFGPILLRRTGRGGYQYFFTGQEFKGTPVPLKGHLIAKGKPSATGNHRKLPRSYVPSMRS